MFQLYSVVFFCRKKKARGRFFILCLSSFGKLWGRATWEKSQISLVRKILLSMSKYIKELDLLFVHYSFWRSGWCMKFLWDTPNTEAQLGVPPPPALVFTCFQLCQQGFSSLCIAMMAAIFHAWCGALCPSSHSLQTWKPPMSSSKTWISAAQRTVLVAREMLSGLRKWAYPLQTQTHGKPQWKWWQMIHMDLYRSHCWSSSTPVLYRSSSYWCILV